MKLAVILARKGSKRIPNKNFKKFLGKQVIEWSIDAARKSKIFEKDLSLAAVTIRRPPP